MKQLSLLLTILVTFNTYSGVNLKNGNFYISYTDVIAPGNTNPLEITRTYNSRSPEKGWFGLGWGSAFETKLVVSADGAVVIHENGAGATTRFTPKKQINGKQAAKKIVAAIKKSNANSANTKKLINQLAKDAELRHAYAREFGVKADISQGTKLYSNRRGLQELIKTKRGFVRKSANGKQEFFNQHGKLTEIRHKPGGFVKLIPENRKTDQELKLIKNSSGKNLTFQWYSSGRVKEISLEKAKASYVYKKDDLVSSTDVEGNTFKYQYDSNHNLTNIMYQNGKSTVITYYRKTQFTSSVTKPNREKKSYEFGSNPKKPDLHYWTKVTKAGISGGIISNRYEYEIRIKPDGEQYTYKITTNINGTKTQTIYSEKSLPLKIVKNNRVTSFQYDNKGLLRKKISPNGIQIALSYDKKCQQKIAQVSTAKRWTKFSYDKKCNLTRAVNSRGKTILLTYDRKDRITIMLEKDKKTKKSQALRFVYNASGKPMEIRMEKVGKINVQYNSNGSIKKVDSKQGYKMANKVTRAFQNLLAIVQPAGVSLTAN